jgi:hypothetical protein
MTRNELAIPLFLIAAAITLAMGAIRQADWRHPTLIGGLLVVAGILFVAGIGWVWFEDVSSLLTQVVKEVATSPVSWFVILIASLISSQFFTSSERRITVWPWSSARFHASSSHKFGTVEVTPANTDDPKIFFKWKV